MKNFFKIHPITYLVLLSIVLSGYFNYFLIIFFILLIHDFGHIITLKYFNYKINHLLILPFGSIIDSNLNSCSKTSEILLISISGVIMQIILYPLMYFLNFFFVSDISYHIFLQYNWLIIIFNLLPIIPLDGSKIMLSILESLFSYKKALKIMNVLSILVIIIFIIYLSFQGLNALLIVFFLIYKTFYEIKNHDYLFNNFLLIRALNNQNSKKVKYINNLKKIFKNKHNFINSICERKILKAYYRLNH